MDWLREHAWETWLALSIGLGVLEMFSLDFVLLMLAAGAAVGMIAALLGLPLILQVLLAAGAAVLSLAVIRPTVVKRLHQGPELQLGHAKLIGQRAVVLEEITSTQAGLIKLDGEQWTARPYDESLAIAAGEAVEVLEIRGATAMVHPVPRLES
ncbi:MAG TPA: NfeD family protein [Nocardioides sp.]|jgi:membrane protein implicated in regulation of membrane protease activity|uniref:Membrane protein implicated in regulation of membrane protease activity n=1 Tax=Nocardioides daedukensis TaxID=634462 RepID=A0A7Y9UVK8_9ACTN|nr:NfeD family protein [Nocardioides daedukensis]NYG57720.1 membrane protein implicated in regulation of membrane protease activity [Nocardioides daedukensis]